MKTKLLSSKTYKEARQKLKDFMLRLEKMNDQTDCSAIKSFNQELELFLDSYSDNHPDGFLESLKQYNRTGTWCNISYLQRIIQHFISKWQGNSMVRIIHH